MRIIISAPVEKPNVFQVSKVETAPLFGLKRLTFAQDKFDSKTDLEGDIIKTENNTDIYYYSYTNKLVPPDYKLTDEDKKAEKSENRCETCAAEVVESSYKALER